MDPSWDVLLGTFVTLYHHQWYTPGNPMRGKRRSDELSFLHYTSMEVGRLVRSHGKKRSKTHPITKGIPFPIIPMTLRSESVVTLFCIAFSLLLCFILGNYSIITWMQFQLLSFNGIPSTDEFSLSYFFSPHSSHESFQCQVKKAHFSWQDLRQMQAQVLQVVASPEHDFWTKWSQIWLKKNSQ